MHRRDFLRFLAAEIAGGISLTGCGADDRPTARRPSPDNGPDRDGRRALVAYFSRAGENYWNGGRRNLAVGNTEVLVRSWRRGSTATSTRSKHPFGGK
jgi:hypothetical protein